MIILEDLLLRWTVGLPRPRALMFYAEAVLRGQSPFVSASCMAWTQAQARGGRQ